MAIKLLAPEIASQIAAGEVIERPASVVKELLENALDAGATQVEIQIESAGKRLVEVSDNGDGIPADEIETAVARHATSKLSAVEDLLQIKTLGFRGEALASIGSVSRFTITSRPATASVGVRLWVQGGVIESNEPVGTPKGTLVRVEDLFYNVPARLKFLKTDQTERRQIDLLVTRYALAYPNVRFRLRQEGRLGFQTSGNGSRREILAALYGVDVARQMVEVVFQDDLVQVTGFVSSPGLSRGNRQEITFFVNGRPVQDSALVSAVLQAYHTLLMVGRYPITKLFLQISPDEVDVNVHPTKAEVRFRQSGRLFSSLRLAVRQALLANTPVPDIGGVHPVWSPGSGEVAAAKPKSWDWHEPGSNRFLNTTESESTGTAQESGAGAAAQDQFPRPGGISILRLVGQLAATYLVAEGPDGLYLIDQHAAHERVLFERLLSQQAEAQKSGLPNQTLLEPVVVQFPPGSSHLLEEQLPVLKKFGFLIESFGPETYQVRSIPVLLAHMDPAAALRVLVEDFEEDEAPLQTEIEARIAARVCKRAAVKAGQTLSVDEQRKLLDDLEQCNSPRTCPHGRPTMIHLSVDLLERQFGRRGPR